MSVASVNEGCARVGSVPSPRSQQPFTFATAGGMDGGSGRSPADRVAAGSVGGPTIASTGLSLMLALTDLASETPLALSVAATGAGPTTGSSTAPVIALGR